ncbi:uncharacterized protein PGRI_006360 [Penicillium griseofulvum]|uniref:Uncharacterized protein n=1 Tax=Penicillium patulum TaxID=5078 RepID=A0A135LXA5_PENPA|nr:uncharacterized protein PGRI_006360 [Penicillium griseofulvum]KXG53586.1 hypothetical protein PGRI_006360 [Penicillium griseofulvum]
MKNNSPDKRAFKQSSYTAELDPSFLLPIFPLTPTHTTKQIQISKYPEPKLPILNSNPRKMQSMFYFDGELIPEPEYDPRQVLNWVNVYIKARDSHSDDETLMRTVAAYIRTSTASISVHAKHHEHPLCVSIKVPGDYHSNKASIFAAAELQADYYCQEIRNGRVRINRALLFRRQVSDRR